MKRFQIVYLFFFLVLAFGCKNNQKKEEIKIEPDDINSIDKGGENEKAVKKVFFNLPSPIELTQILLEANSTYSAELLNPISNLNNYTSSAKLALNFGVYGADLCYCRVFDQLQESISYLATIRKITEKLQIPEEEGSKTINRIEESIENRDSIFQIIADTYANANSYLKENERDLTATLILAGAWVEGMHFATKINEDNSLDSKIAEQKFALVNLMEILKQYKDNSEIKKFYSQFEKLDTIYKNIDISYDKPVVITDQETGVTTIDNTSSIKITQQQLDEIATLIGEIRYKIIS